MSKETVLALPSQSIGTNNNPGRSVSFSVGSPEPVSAIVPDDQWRAWWNGKYYETPVDFYALAKTMDATSYHCSPIYLKLQMLVSSYVPHTHFSRADFKRWALDRLITGNHYLQRVTSRLGGTIKYKPSPAVYTRRGKDEGEFYFLHYHGWTHLLKDQIEELSGDVYKLIDPDPLQEIYGKAQYMGALNAIFLSEGAGLFRRRYYLNGNHSGYILHITDSHMSEGLIDSLEDQVKSAKGPGNFRSLLLHSPGGEKDGVKLIPVGNTKTEDDFGAIKNISHEEITYAHRAPPQIMGVTPKNGGAALGDARTAAENFMDLEIAPLQEDMKEINELVGDEIIRFKPFAHHLNTPPSND